MSVSGEMPFKVGIHRRRDGIVEFRYANTFERQDTEQNPRLLIAPSEGQVELLLRMLRELNSPYSLMYVLLAPHTDARPGRYLVSGLSEDETRTLLLGFRTFFEGDARHHLWIASERDNALLVYDQHNVIYAYGPIDQFSAILAAQGLQQSKTEFPYPHTHHFRSSMNVYEDLLLREFDWQWSPLLPEDEE